MKHAPMAQSQIVAMRCGVATFGLPIASVREIVMVPEITPVPESGRFVRGIINLRGRILPVLDLGDRLGLGRGPTDGSGRILIVEHEGRHPFGLLVDEASEVLRIPEELVGPPPELAASALSGSVKAVARIEDRLILLLELPRILGDDAERHAAGEAAAP